MEATEFRIEQGTQPSSWPNTSAYDMRAMKSWRLKNSGYNKVLNHRHGLIQRYIIHLHGNFEINKLQLYRLRERMYQILMRIFRCQVYA